MSVRIPRQAKQWRTIAADTLWTDAGHPMCLNGSPRVLPYIDRFQLDPPPTQARYQLDGGPLASASEKPNLMSLSGQCSGLNNIVSVCCQPIRAMQQPAGTKGCRSHHGWVFGEDHSSFIASATKDPQPVDEKPRWLAIRSLGEVWTRCFR